MTVHANIQFPLINAVLQKLQEGRIFEIDNKHFVIHKSGFSGCNEAIDITKFIDFIANERQLPRYFHIYNPSSELVEKIKNDKRFGFKYRKRIQLRYLNEGIETNNYNSFPGDYTVENINQNNFESLDIFHLKLENKFWSSKDDFLKNSYGVVACNEKHQPVSLCYASCVVNSISEIDIVTLPEYQGKGLAKMVTEQFIKMSIDKNIQANWDCFEENIASLKTAIHLGFTKLHGYFFLSVFNKSRNHE